MNNKKLKFIMANEAEFEQIFNLYKEVIAKTKTNYGFEFYKYELVF